MVRTGLFTASILYVDHHPSRPSFFTRTLSYGTAQTFEDTMMHLPIQIDGWNDLASTNKASSMAPHADRKGATEPVVLACRP
jgi:hypothetical protein